ncbi:MAG TPA: methionyl-tRNA formyltransferase [Verrucomicrobiae bacterium]|nr:methionyl-tRNA formyltransferase [Verrucomicrobiae bacterium]
MPALRIIFMGSASLSCASLQALLSAPGVQVVAAITQPDRPKGRDLKLHASPVKELAASAGLPVLQPQRARDPRFGVELSQLRPDLIAVAAYGQILPQTILDLPPHGCVNVHTSLLPKYRGAAPIQWAILNDEPQTGATIMKMDAGLDTGAILAQAATPIYPHDTAETLHDRLAQLGADLLVRTIPDYVAGKCQPHPQSAEGATFAPKIKKEDGCIDWNQPARVIWNRVRGLTPWPGTFTFIPAAPTPHLLKIWQADVVDVQGTPGEVLRAEHSGIVIGCGQRALRVLILQLEGGRRLSAGQFLAGHSLEHGQHLVRDRL